MLRQSPRRHTGKEPKNFLLYFPEDRTCSVLSRSKLDVEGSNNKNLKLGSEVYAKWSDRGQTSIYKGVIVNTDERQTLSELKEEWTEFGQHIRAHDSNPVESFLKLKVMKQPPSSETESESGLHEEPKSKKAKLKKKEEKHKFDSATDDDHEELRNDDKAAKKIIKKWRTKCSAKNKITKHPVKVINCDTDEDSEEEKANEIKKEKKAKRSLIRDYKLEEDNLNREESSAVLDVLEKKGSTCHHQETSLWKDPEFKETLKSVLAEEIKPIRESIGTLMTLYSQMNNHLLYKREKSNKSSRQQFNSTISVKKESSTASCSDSAGVGGDRIIDTTPPPKLFSLTQNDQGSHLPEPSTSGIQESQQSGLEPKATNVAIESEGEVEFVGDSSLGVKAHKDLIIKALDSSTDRKKLALNMLEVVFSSHELRTSTLSGSNTKKKLDGLKIAAIKGFIFKHYPAEDEADRSCAWGKIKEAITDKCKKFRPEKKTYFDNFKH